MSERLEKRYNKILEQSGEQQIDELYAQEVKLGRPLGAMAQDGLAKGLMASLLQGRGLEPAHRKGRYRPGVDRPSDIDINSVYVGEGDELMARKRNKKAMPNVVHMVIDIPKRHDSLTGNYSTRQLARYMMSLTIHHSQIAGTQGNLYLRNSLDQAGLMAEDIVSDPYIAFRKFDNLHSGDPISSARTPQLKDQLIHAWRHTDKDHDTAVVVSDFLDGYREEEDRFEWERPLQEMHEDLDGRLWVLRMVSPAQKKLPLGLIEAFDHQTVAEINTAFKETAEKKDARIRTSLEETRHINVDTFRDGNEEHPVRAIGNFILGAQTVEA